MITKTSCFCSSVTNPFHNQAVEEYLLEAVEEGECILYLWQNNQTVVIGQNQNAWKECRVEALEGSGGHLARRLSGGGAVFHDQGNLNFTWLLRKAEYDVEKQLEVLLTAVRALGVEAEKSGRNDITVDGKKISGNAFYTRGDHCYHHGTILLDVNRESLAEYLSVSKEKLSSKGVDSVRSRVTNLKEYVPELTVEKMKEQMLKSFAEIYGLVPKALSEELFDQEKLAKLEEKYASWEWRLGKKLAFSWEIGQRFVWGEIQIQIEADSGRVKQAMVYSDAMNPGLILKIPAALQGCECEDASLVGRIQSLAEQEGITVEEKGILWDIAAMLRKKGVL